MSESAISLIKGLLADKSSRIMYEGIVAHPFLSDLDMENMKQGLLIEVYLCVRILGVCMERTIS